LQLWVLWCSLIVILMLGVVLVFVFIVKVLILVGVVCMSGGLLIVCGGGPSHPLFGFFGLREILDWLF
jgi:hypothetical protein